MPEKSVLPKQDFAPVFHSLSPRSQTLFRNFVLTMWGISVGAVSTLSMLSQGMVTRIVPEGLWDKAEHATAYFVVSFLPGIALKTRRERLGAALAMVALGMVLERTQALAPGRSTDILDAFANAAGAAFGWITSEIIQKLADFRKTS